MDDREPCAIALGTIGRRSRLRVADVLIYREPLPLLGPVLHLQSTPYSRWRGSPCHDFFQSYSVGKRDQQLTALCAACARVVACGGSSSPVLLLDEFDLQTVPSGQHQLVITRSDHYLHIYNTFASISNDAISFAAEWVSDNSPYLALCVVLVRVVSQAAVFLTRIAVAAIVRNGSLRRVSTARCESSIQVCGLHKVLRPQEAHRLALYMTNPYPCLPSSPHRAGTLHQFHPPL